MEFFPDSVWVFIFAAYASESRRQWLEEHSADNITPNTNLQPARIPRPRFYPERRLLDGIREDRVVKLYRLSPSAIYELYELLHEDLDPKMPTNKAVPGMCKLLGALHFLASGTYQPTLAEVAGMSQATFSRSLSQFLKAILKHSGKFIKFPQCDAEWRAVKGDFYELANMPNVIGAIDCTHIAMTAPKQMEEYYRNRKFFHSLNVQMVCDANLRIMNVNARFPGSTHDAFILQQSAICRMFEEGAFPNGWLLGDAGYGNRSWLLTPLSNPHGTAGRRYQKAHKKTRVVIEQTFGVLKSRFRCLDRGKGLLLYSPAKVCSIVVACSILHNICIAKKLEMEIDPLVPLDMNLSSAVFDVVDLGSDTRQDVIAGFFSSCKCNLL
ncbi:putative nuclease HARBI1 [Pseudophryne corroboree]|uniref:putative nuclease HARBI1 n=1 Tax=Pseudophryne corroboree TaxID=495146 RepID=UPI003081FE0D